MTRISSRVSKLPTAGASSRGTVAMHVQGAGGEEARAGVVISEEKWAIRFNRLTLAQGLLVVFACIALLVQLFLWCCYL